MGQYALNVFFSERYDANLYVQVVYVCTQLMFMCMTRRVTGFSIMTQM